MLKQKFPQLIFAMILALGCVASRAAEPLNLNFKNVAGADWGSIPRAELVEISKRVMAMPDIAIKAQEDILRIKSLGLDWDVAAMVYEPVDTAKIPSGADGKKIGVFMLHGGSGDHRSMDKFARFLATKFGYKVVNMSYPGRLNLDTANHDWPGDTINADGTVRTPHWLKGSYITSSQYEVVEDKEESRRRRWGTLFLACAKPGTEFYDRMAGWPAAFEDGGVALLTKHLPAAQFSVYAHGHSTGGPFTMIFSQRVPNMAGILGMESSPFGALYGKMTREIQGIAETWEAGFHCLRIRSWRDTARYYGYELIQREGTKALERLAMVMEEVLDDWKKETWEAQFKAENIIHFDSPSQLADAARAAAKRLKMSEADTKKLVDRYVGYLKEMSGPGVKPVPPLYLNIASNSRDHDPQIYEKVYLPGYAAMKPAPRVRLVQLDAGTHGYTAAEEGLPLGIAPVGALLWHEAIVGGFFKK